MTKEVTDIFYSKVIPAYMNETLIALIPKNQRPEKLSNFKSISLCSSIYKVVTEIIVGHIRPYLDKLISLTQTAFVPGRKGHDNVIIA